MISHTWVKTLAQLEYQQSNSEMPIETGVDRPLCPILERYIRLDSKLYLHRDATQSCGQFSNTLCLHEYSQTFNHAMEQPSSQSRQPSNCTQGFRKFLPNGDTCSWNGSTIETCKEFLLHPFCFCKAWPDWQPTRPLFQPSSRFSSRQLV